MGTRPQEFRCGAQWLRFVPEGSRDVVIEGRQRFGSLVGSTPEMLTLFRTLERYAGDSELRPPPYARGRERSADPPRDGPRPGAPVEVITRRSNPELNQRRYDWSPPVPNAPREMEVDQRLRRWREAQAAIDLTVRGPREVAGPAGSLAAVSPLAPDGTGAERAGGASACAPPQRDRSLAGQGDHRRVRAAVRSLGASRGRAASAPAVARGPSGDRPEAAGRARSPATRPAGSAGRSASKGPWPTDSRPPSERSRRHHRKPRQVGARATSLRLDPAAHGHRRDRSRASRPGRRERATKTAVQLRTLAGDERPRAELLFCTPCDLKEGTFGPVARFESGEVVAYQIRSRRRRRLFVFRTLDVDDAFTVAVPGVSPHVQLLLELRTGGRIRLARSLFAYLLRRGWDPSALPDAFYVRVGAVLAGRLPAHKVLLHLLRATRESPIEQPANRTAGPGWEGANR